VKYSEFNEQLQRLIVTYGEKVFPDERRGAFWKRYEHTPAEKFAYAVDMVVLRMPQPAAIVDVIDAEVKADSGNGFSRREEADKTPINPKAKELAAQYVPLIREAIRKIGGALPYDKKKRLG
jgi:hypothetical protein